MKGEEKSRAHEGKREKTGQMKAKEKNRADERKKEKQSK